MRFTFGMVAIDMYFDMLAIFNLHCKLYAHCESDIWEGQGWGHQVATLGGLEWGLLDNAV